MAQTAGYFIMSVLHFLIGTCLAFGLKTPVVVMIWLQIFFFGMTIGPIMWLYIAETLCDKALGIASLSQWIGVILISLSTPTMLNSPLQPEGTFWLFSSLCFLGFLFCLCFVKETKGLSDDQQKTLYEPRVTLV